MSQTLKTGGTGLEHKVLEALKEKIDVYGDDSEIRSEETPWGTVEILTAWFDRFANIESSLLLQCIEEFGGVTLLATNNMGNMDRTCTCSQHGKFLY